MSGDQELSLRTKLGIISVLKRRHRTRYYISFSLRNSYNPATGKWDRAAWPILFLSREDAERACSALPIFKNAEIAGIKSASVESVQLPPLTITRRRTNQP